MRVLPHELYLGKWNSGINMQKYKLSIKSYLFVAMFNMIFLGTLDIGEFMYNSGWWESFFNSFVGLLDSKWVFG